MEFGDLQRFNLLVYDCFFKVVSFFFMLMIRYKKNEKKKNCEVWINNVFVCFKEFQCFGIICIVFGYYFTWL